MRSNICIASTSGGLHLRFPSAVRGRAEIGFQSLGLGMVHRMLAKLKAENLGTLVTQKAAVGLEGG